MTELKMIQWWDSLQSQMSFLSFKEIGESDIKIQFIKSEFELLSSQFQNIWI